MSGGRDRSPARIACLELKLKGGSHRVVHLWHLACSARSISLQVVFGAGCREDPARGSVDRSPSDFCRTAVRCQLPTLPTVASRLESAPFSNRFCAASLTSGASIGRLLQVEKSSIYSVLTVRAPLGAQVTREAARMSSLPPQTLPYGTVTLPKRWGCGLVAGRRAA